MLLDFLTKPFRPVKARRTSTKPFSVVIPTKNSARHIDVILEYYRGCGFEPIACVDDSSDDDTLEICRRFGPTVSIKNPAGYAEFVLDQVCMSAGGGWVLRMDDDELPTKAMLQECERLATSDNQFRQFGFQRKQCLLSAHGALAHLPSAENDTNHVRLLHASSVEYVTTIHTPGFRTPGEVRVGDHAVFAHLQWIVSPPEKRQKKIAAYDAVQPNAGSAFKEYYLIEQNAEALSGAEQIDFPEFSEPAARLRERFPDALMV